MKNKYLLIGLKTFRANPRQVQISQLNDTNSNALLRRAASSCRTDLSIQTSCNFCRRETRGTQWRKLRFEARYPESERSPRSISNNPAKQLLADSPCNFAAKKQSLQGDRESSSITSCLLPQSERQRVQRGRSSPWFVIASRHVRPLFRLSPVAIPAKRNAFRQSVQLRQPFHRSSRAS